MGAVIQGLGSLAQSEGQAFTQQREYDLQRMNIERQIAAMQSLYNYRQGQLDLGQQRVDNSVDRTGIYRDRSAAQTAQGWGQLALKNEGLVRAYRAMGLQPNASFNESLPEGPDNQRFLPVPKEQMTPQEQANLSAKELLPKVQQAKIDLDKARTDYISNPNNPMFRLQMMKAQIAYQNSQREWQRLALSQAQFGEKKQTQAGFDPALDADRRLGVMLDAYQNPSPQNDVALLFNHIGMTLSAQRGARMSEAEIDRAIKSRSLPGDLQAAWERVQNGQFLTPQQRFDMVQLGIKNRELLWDQANRKADFIGAEGSPEPAPYLKDFPTPARKPKAAPQQAAPSFLQPYINDPKRRRITLDNGDVWEVGGGSYTKVSK